MLVVMHGSGNENGKKKLGWQSSLFVTCGWNAKDAIWAHSRVVARHIEDAFASPRLRTGHSLDSIHFIGVDNDDNENNNEKRQTFFDYCQVKKYI